VFEHLLAKPVILATPGEYAMAWGKFGGKLLRHNGNPVAIQYAAAVMSTSCTKGVVNDIGDAQLVYGKFHASQKVVKACDQVRKAESRADGGKRNWLERTQWIWIKDRAKWTEKGSPKMGIDRPRTVCRRHCLRAEVGASRHLRLERRWGRFETGRKLVRLGTSDAEIDKGVVRAYDPKRAG
jgi:hypothetical protein